MPVAASVPSKESLFALQIQCLTNTSFKSLNCKCESSRLNAELTTLTAHQCYLAQCTVTLRLTAINTFKLLKHIRITVLNMIKSSEVRLIICTIKVRPVRTVMHLHSLLKATKYSRYPRRLSTCVCYHFLIQLGVYVYSAIRRTRRISSA